MRRRSFGLSKLRGTIEVYESPERPGWLIVTLSGPVGVEHFKVLALQMIATVEGGVPEVVVDTRDVVPPVAELASMLHRCAQLLSWAGGALIVTNPSKLLARRLHALGDSDDLVMVA